MAVTVRLRALTSKRMRVNSVGMRNAAYQLGNQLGSEATKQLSKYPPPKFPSGYVRTGRLGTGWTHTVTSPASGIVLRIRNSVFYSNRVHGDAHGQGQWLMHAQTGWPLFERIIFVLRIKWVGELRGIYARHPIIFWS